ncbi:hypothetical protein PRZ48_001755 [Zasmidium cellare]|uniref:Uncharacterized protein n=1 Tax=Zasmidium cellare TaxID=395010 RepID=A0ABR0F3Z8_ZASCE|nr:hypothetical protein PRZ48_001755 [Zasmidium cellare]
MARRSGRLSSGTGPVAKHKRAASGSNEAVAMTKRPKKQQATPTKSQYFEGGDEDDSDPLSAEETASEFGGGSAESAESLGPDEEDEEEEDSDEATSRGKNSAKNAKIWKPGAKTGLGPGKQLVVKKPKARPAGKTPYSDDTIHPNTMLFLGELKDNNERSWLKMHDAEFRQAEKDWHSFVEKMTEKLTEVDETIPELPVKDVSRTGRKSAYAHYYIQIAPNKSWVAGPKPGQAVQ